MRILTINIYNNNARGPELYRIDYGTKIKLVGVDLPYTYEVHFGKSRTEDAYRQIGDETGVIVPDALLQTDGTLYGWLYVHTGADDGWTKREFSCPVKNRAPVSNAEPTPVQQDIIEQTIAALNSGVEHVEEIAEAIPDTIEAALTEAKESGEFDGPKGDKGDPGYTPQKGVDYFDGAPGEPGKDGVSPAATVSKSGKVATITITDKDGTTTAQISDGEDGQPGAPGTPGSDGISPTATVSKSGTTATITITDKNGTTTAQVQDGAKGDPGDNYVLTAQDKEDIAGMVDAPVQDVQVNGTSILSQGVANVPMGSKSGLGVVKVHNTANYGVQINSSGEMYISSSTQNDVKDGTNNYKPIVPGVQDRSTFYGLAKAAGDSTQSSSSNSVGTYTDSAKSAISQMLNGSVAVSGTTPTITALPGIRYVCGEVSTLDITLPASGIVDVVFESGSTPTVLTITPPTGVTLKWANGFDPDALEADTTYEINVADGLGVAAAWS